MQMTLQEGSEFFRGLLLLIRTDHKITDEEKTWLKRIGKSFGFAPTFCSIVIDEILENRYISDKPPVFSSEEIAKMFIDYGLVISYCDNDIHKSELQWLRVVAESNGIEDAWVLQQKENLIKSIESKNNSFDELVKIFAK